MEKIDLHIHTRFSDGELDLLELRDRMLDNELNKIAITDHDTIIRLKKAKELFLNSGIEMITGIEFNTAERNMHILGYGIDDLNKVESAINEIKFKNMDAYYKTIFLLQQEGIEISSGEVQKVIVEDDKARLKCYADEMMALGILDYAMFDDLQPNTIPDKRMIVKYLIKKGYVKSVLEAYEKYIGRGQSCYVPIDKLSQYDVIKLINESGGVPVLAHPVRLGYSDKKIEDTIKDLKSWGLEGLEVYGTRMIPEKQKLYENLADKYDLIMTAGSDFHTRKENIGINCKEEVWKTLVKKIESKKGGTAV